MGLRVSHRWGSAPNPAGKGLRQTSASVLVTDGARPAAMAVDGAPRQSSMGLCPRLSMGLRPKPRRERFTGRLRRPFWSRMGGSARGYRWGSAPNPAGKGLRGTSGSALTVGGYGYRWGSARGYRWGSARGYRWGSAPNPAGKGLRQTSASVLVTDGAPPAAIDGAPPAAIDGAPRQSSMGLRRKPRREGFYVASWRRGAVAFTPTRDIGGGGRMAPGVRQDFGGAVLRRSRERLAGAARPMALGRPGSSGVPCGERESSELRRGA